MYLWFIAAAVAYFIKGLCGFANTLVFTTILSFGSSNIDISPIDLLIGYPANIILSWKNRKDLKPKVFLPLAVLVLAGSMPGAFLLKNVDTRMIKLVFGIVVVLLGMEMLSRQYSKNKVHSSKILLAVVGIASGVLCGLFGVGALLAAYVSRVTDNSASFKANISIVFLIENTFRMILYSILQVLTFETVKMSFALFPFALFGLFAGIKCGYVINEKHVQKMTAILLLFSGVSLILKNL